MPPVLLLSGPAPSGPAGPYPLGFCMVCAATWKHAAYAGVRERAESAEHSREGGILRLALTAPPDQPPPQPAAAWGFFGPFMPPPLGTGQYPGVMPLCWTHLMMLENRPGGTTLLAASPLPPQHLRGGVILDR